MKTEDIAEGLDILDGHQEKTGGHTVSVERSVIVVRPTYRIIEGDFLKRLVDLGWKQTGSHGYYFTVSDYRHERAWWCHPGA